LAASFSKSAGDAGAFILQNLRPVAGSGGILSGYEGFAMTANEADEHRLLTRAGSILDQTMISVYVLRHSLRQRRALQVDVAERRSALRLLRERLARLRSSFDLAV
jgi:hypothetical protein